MIEQGNNHSRGEPKPSDYANDSDDSAVGGREVGAPILERRLLSKGR